MVQGSAIRRITTIGFDADDTLWSHAPHYGFAEERFVALLAHVGDEAGILARLRAVEAANLLIYGFGVKGFVLSMLETAVALAGSRIDDSIVADIIACGKVLLKHPIVHLAHAEAVVTALAECYRLVLITRGDLFDQERKIADSGLAARFSAVEIVSDKTARTYSRIFEQHADGAHRAVMVGNSLKSDILPAIEAGCWGIYVPQDVGWVVERAEFPPPGARFRQIPHLGALATALDDIEQAERAALPENE